MVSLVSSLPYMYVHTHSTPQLLFQLSVKGMHNPREKQRMNNEMFLRTGRQCLIENCVICLIQEDRLALSTKPK